MEETKKTWGGARKGAGRKSVRGNVKTIAVRVPQDIVDILSDCENKADYIVEAIRFYHFQKK